MGSEELERLHQEIESLRAEVRQLRESTAKFVNGSVARDSKAQPEESRPGKGLAGELEEIEHEPERFKSFIREHPYYVAILLVIACAVAGGIYAAWRYLESYEVTSDARVVGDISPISSQVPGTVTKVLVNNDQRVQAGQPLVQLDASEYKLLVDRSRAMRDGARAAAEAARSQNKAAQAETHCRLWPPHRSCAGRGAGHGDSRTAGDGCEDCRGTRR
jgi:acetyl/propionyl-CoA carboxylase alpha subunit